MIYWLDLIILVLILGAAASVISYLSEEAGIIHVAGAAIMGIGSYTSVLAVMRLNVPVFLALISTILTGFICGVILYFLTRRLTAAYLALVTLAFAVIIYGIINNWIWVTEGPMGISAVPSLFRVRYLEFLLCLILAGVISILIKYVTGISFGSRVRALRDDELLSEDLLLNPQKTRFILFTVSSCILSLLGGIYAHHLRFIDPSSFSIKESISLLAMGLVLPISLPVRGLGGALLFIFIPELIRFIGLPTTIGAQLRQAIFGLLLLIVIWNGKLSISKFKEKVKSNA